MDYLFGPFSLSLLRGVPSCSRPIGAVDKEQFHSEYNSLDAASPQREGLILYTFFSSMIDEDEHTFQKIWSWDVLGELKPQ